MSKILKKIKDPKIFTIPIQISESDINQALIYLGERINVIPLLLFNTLGLGGA